MKDEKPRILEALELTKSYGGKAVVDSVSMNIHAGEVVGILGPNGAGKTTTFSMIIGLTKPDSGKIFLNGEGFRGLPVSKPDTAHVFSQVGFTSEYFQDPFPLPHTEPRQGLQYGRPVM